MYDWVLPLAWFTLLVALLFLGHGWTAEADGGEPRPDRCRPCGPPYHLHTDGTCHVHCRNGMSLHHATHGQDCTVVNPTPRPRRPRPTATPTPAPRPVFVPPVVTNGVPC